MREARGSQCLSHHPPSRPIFLPPSASLPDTLVSHHQIRLGQLVRQLLPVPLRQAAGDDDAAHAALALEARRLDDRLNRLVLGVLHKPGVGVFRGVQRGGG